MRNSFARTNISFLIVIFVFVLVYDISTAGEFRNTQQRYFRVREARKNTEALRDSLLNGAGLGADSLRIFIQAFKHERILELWGAGCNSFIFKLLKVYRFTSSCGILGPKRAQGDLQIPEGFYRIDRFNPSSRFHLSVGINYPNKSDRLRTRASNPGGDIFIHGSKVTIGCIPLGDSNIESLYIFAVDACDAGQGKIPVYIYPACFDDPENNDILEEYRSRSSSNRKLWTELEAGYNYFRKHRIPPKFKIDNSGEYIILDQSSE